MTYRSDFQVQHSDVLYKPQTVRDWYQSAK